MERVGSIYVLCDEIALCERIAFFLRSETRPLFPEDVPAHEENLVAAFEEVDTPTSLRCDGTTLDANFGDFYDFESAEVLVKAVALLAPREIYLYFADDEETQHYYRYAEGGLQFLFSEIPLDPEREARFNRRLPEHLRNALLNCEDPADGLRLIAEHFENKDTG